MKTKWIATIATLACLVQSPALAQFSESYNFLKAVRERAWKDIVPIVTKPSSGPVIINTQDASSGEGALHILAKGRELQLMEYLLAKGAKADLRDTRGNTPLIVASRIGHVEGASLLLRGKASVDMANNSGETPLIVAVQNRNAALVELLMKAGANPDKTDRMAGLSAREYAARDRRSANILKLLDVPRKKPAAAAAGPKI
jgi:uncharacterized protein